MLLLNAVSTKQIHSQKQRPVNIGKDAESQVIMLKRISPHLKAAKSCTGSDPRLCLFILQLLQEADKGLRKTSNQSVFLASKESDLFF